jgi:glycosyltransferase involved in cell wall biosynthesis
MNGKKISVIMPCYLGDYNGGAKDRALKLNRAIQSFLRQDYSNKELIIIADGCHATTKFIEINGYEKEQNNIFKHYIPKQDLFSGNVRDFGLKIATGDYIAYLDSDDMFRDNNHLSSIMQGFNNNPDCDWVYFNDLVKYFALEHLPVTERDAALTFGSIGVSNIAHKNTNEISWDGCHGYGHDFTFISRLMAKFPNRKKISGCSYVVCHIPNTCDT